MADASDATPPERPPIDPWLRRGVRAWWAARRAAASAEGPRRLVARGLFALAWTLRATARGRVGIRAGSLAFSTLLAMLPALALAFALAGATGLYDVFVDETLRPFLDEVLGPRDAPASAGVLALRETAEGLLALVANTDLAGLGAGGVVALALALLRVVRGAEEAFEHVFVRQGPGRTVLERARAWALVLLVAPLGLTFAVTSASVAHAPHTGAWLAVALPSEVARGALLFVLPPVLVATALYAVYVELAPRRLGRPAALVASTAAALAWYALQLAHVRFQVGLARWNALYSGFGAFPVLLASIHASWLIVLAGAQLAARLDAPLRPGRPAR